MSETCTICHRPNWMSWRFTCGRECRDIRAAQMVSRVAHTKGAAARKAYLRAEVEAVVDEIVNEAHKSFTAYCCRCGNPYEVNLANINRGYCSRECRIELLKARSAILRWHELHKPVCVVCGKETGDVRRKTCSPECRKKSFFKCHTQDAEEKWRSLPLATRKKIRKQRMRQRLLELRVKLGLRRSVGADKEKQKAAAVLAEVWEEKTRKADDTR